jgi:protein-tyrosine phosphatase
MIDMHSHILPGLDDGSPDLDTSLEMARRSVADGINLMLATPHVNGRFMPDPDEVLGAVAELNDALAREHIPLVVSPGAEIAVAELGVLDDETLGAYTLGASKTLLVESPYVDGVPLFDEIVFGAQAKGFRIVLAHPERSPMFRTDLEALEALVERGVMCSVTSGSMRGRFGRRVMRSTLELVRRGLVHNVSSDCHDLAKRPPGLCSGFEGAENVLPGVTALSTWLTESVPGALLSDEPLPPAPIVEGEGGPRRLRLRGLLR